MSTERTGPDRRSDHRGAASGEELARLEAENAALSAALGEAELLFASFMDQIPDRCVLLDEELRYRYLNRAAAAAPSFDPQARIGEPIRTLREGDPRGLLEPYRAVLASGESFVTSAAVRDEEGAERRFTVRAFKAGSGLGLVWTEVTESRRSEERLSAIEAELGALAQHILEVREEERKAVARELHDELGQALTAIELELRAMARVHKDVGEAQRKRLGELLYMTNQAIRSVQRLCSELRPAILDRLGLEAAIEWLSGEMASRSALIPSLRIAVREGAIGPKASTAMFRIIQESLTNVVRHAGAASFAIELEEEGGAVLLRVRDDGVGISEAQASSPGSFGIQGIRERARGLGGSASIRGGPGLGTELEVRIPLPPEGRLP